MDLSWCRNRNTVRQIKCSCGQSLCIQTRILLKWTRRSLVFLMVNVSCWNWVGEFSHHLSEVAKRLSNCCCILVCLTIKTHWIPPVTMVMWSMRRRWRQLSLGREGEHFGMDSLSHGRCVSEQWGERLQRPNTESLAEDVPQSGECVSVRE